MLDCLVPRLAGPCGQLLRTSPDRPETARLGSAHEVRRIEVLERTSMRRVAGGRARSVTKPVLWRLWATRREPIVPSSRDVRSVALSRRWLAGLDRRSQWSWDAAGSSPV